MDRRPWAAYLEDILLRREAKLLASDGEGDVGQAADLVTVHHSLAAAQKGKAVTQTRQLVLNLRLGLIVGQRNLHCAHTK